MITLIWKEEKSKRVELKMKSGTATLHFVKDLEINIPDVIWTELSKKLSDAINTKRLEVVKSKKEKKPKKNAQIKDEDEINIEEL